MTGKRTNHNLTPASYPDYFPLSATAAATQWRSSRSHPAARPSPPSPEERAHSAAAECTMPTARMRRRRDGDASLPGAAPSRFFLGAEQSLIDRSMREGRADGGDGDLIACWRVLRPESKDEARSTKRKEPAIVELWFCFFPVAGPDRWRSVGAAAAVFLSLRVSWGRRKHGARV